MRSHKLTRRSQGFSLIELLIVISIIGIMAAVAIPQLQAHLKRSREAAAKTTLQEMHRAQAQYYSVKGKFTNLNDLVDGEMLRRGFGEGKTIGGYTFSTSDLTNNTFTIHADRASDGDGYQDFNIDEKGDIYFIENKTKGSVARGQGNLVSDSESGEAKKEGSPAAK